MTIPSTMCRNDATEVITPLELRLEKYQKSQKKAFDLLILLGEIRRGLILANRFEEAALRFRGDYPSNSLKSTPDTDIRKMVLDKAIEDIGLCLDRLSKTVKIRTNFKIGFVKVIFTEVSNAIQLIDPQYSKLEDFQKHLTYLINSHSEKSLIDSMCNILDEVESKLSSLVTDAQVMLDKFCTFPNLNKNS